MEDRYYSVERRENGDLEVAFIKISGSKLEHIAGENMITKMMEIQGEELKSKDIAKSKYVVLLYDTEFQFDVAVEQYKYALEGEKI